MANTNQNMLKVLKTAVYYSSALVSYENRNFFTDYSSNIYSLLPIASQDTPISCEEGSTFYQLPSTDAICQPTTVTASIRPGLKLQVDDYQLLACEWHWTDVPFIAPPDLHQRHIAVTVQRESPCCLLPVITFPLYSSSFSFYGYGSMARKHNDPLEILLDILGISRIQEMTYGFHRKDIDLISRAS